VAATIILVATNVKKVRLRKGQGFTKEHSPTHHPSKNRDLF